MWMQPERSIRRRIPSTTAERHRAAWVARRAIAENGCGKLPAYSNCHRPGCQAVQPPVDHRDREERLARLRPILVIPAQPAVAVEPRDRPLHHPTPRRQPPPRDRLVPLDDLQQPTAPPPQPVDQLPRITPIRPDQADIGAFGPRSLED